VVPAHIQAEAAEDNIIAHSILIGCAKTVSIRNYKFAKSNSYVYSTENNKEIESLFKKY